MRVESEGCLASWINKSLVGIVLFCIASGCADLLLVADNYSVAATYMRKSDQLDNADLLGLRLATDYFELKTWSFGYDAYLGEHAVDTDSGNEKSPTFSLALTTRWNFERSWVQIGAGVLNSLDSDNSKNALSGVVEATYQISETAPGWCVGIRCDYTDISGFSAGCTFGTAMF